MPCSATSRPCTCPGYTTGHGSRSAPRPRSGAALGLYGTTPDGYPGNDDLGTLSSWYVFGALGLYPEVPGVGVLAIGSPLFRSASVAMPHHRRLRITTSATRATSVFRARYIDGLRIDGRPSSRPWTSWCALRDGGRLDFRLSPHPNRRWGSSAAALPPSFGPGRAMPENACTP